MAGEDHLSIQALNATVKKDDSSNKDAEGNLLQPEQGEASSRESEKNQKFQTITPGRFFSICFNGTIESGVFESVNDVYIKYTILAGPDWVISSGADEGITQIARYKKDGDGKREFAWNQPISISYRSYNFYGWPQLVVSVYNFDTFGSDQILGYGCIHLPVGGAGDLSTKQAFKVYSPQSTSFSRRVLSWLTGKKPELVESSLIARPDCRTVLQMVDVGQLNINFYCISKDVVNNGYRTE